MYLGPLNLAKAFIDVAQFSWASARPGLNWMVLSRRASRWSQIFLLSSYKGGAAEAFSLQRLVAV